MNVTDNMILITGGASGIGRGLAEAFHKLGNQVIISGRRQDVLDEVTAANPGMQSLRLDIADPASITAFAAQIVALYPKLNVLINNAGIMQPEDIASAPDYLDIAERTIATNLLGPIRLSAALLPHLRAQPQAAILTVSSGLAFVPMAATPTYSATKAAIHSYSLALRHQLRETSVQVIEIIPPYVQTELLGAHQANDPAAMPLTDFITEVMQLLSGDAAIGEVVVGRCAPLRFAAENGRMDAMFQAVNGAAH